MKQCGSQNATFQMTTRLSFEHIKSLKKEHYTNLYDSLYLDKTVLVLYLRWNMSYDTQNLFINKSTTRVELSQN